MSGKLEGFDEFINGLEKIGNGGIKDELSVWIDAMGFEFLDIVQDEIIRTETVETRLLLHSFKKGDKHNVYEISDGGMTLEIGTDLDYASYVNDGHWLNKKGQARRWVPGRWATVNEGTSSAYERFVYDPEAKTGMLLKQKWIEGSHYWDSSMKIFNKIFKASFEKKFGQWLERIFGG